MKATSEMPAEIPIESSCILRVTVDNTVKFLVNYKEIMFFIIFSHVSFDGVWLDFSIEHSPYKKVLNATGPEQRLRHSACIKSL